MFLKSRRALENPVPPDVLLLATRFLKRAVVLSSDELACECEVLAGATWGANAEAPRRFVLMSRRVTDDRNIMMNKYELTVCTLGSWYASAFDVLCVFFCWQAEQKRSLEFERQEGRRQKPKTDGRTDRMWIF